MSKSNGSIKSKIETYENGALSSGGPPSSQGPNSKPTSGKDSVGSDNEYRVAMKALVPDW